MHTSVQFVPLSHKREYGESDQTNPIRWELYYLEEDKLLAQTSLFKCKDFFNDVVAWYHGVKGAVYNFDTRVQTYNDFGVFVRLYHVTEQFLSNYEKVVAPLLEQLDVKLIWVPLEKSGEVLTLFPRKLFDNTYAISKITHYIRLCNIKTEVTSIEELLAHNRMEDTTNLKNGTLIPNNSFDKYWYYAGPTANSDNISPYLSVSHNNGYHSWIAATQGQVL